jgi:antitoxin ParD1/3/4
MLVLRKDVIRKKIDEGLQSLCRGEGVDGDAVFDRIEAELEALERKGHN